MWWRLRFDRETDRPIVPQLLGCSPRSTAASGNHAHDLLWAELTVAAKAALRDEFERFAQTLAGIFRWAQRCAVSILPAFEFDAV